MREVPVDPHMHICPRCGQCNHCNCPKPSKHPIVQVIEKTEDLTIPNEIAQFGREDTPAYMIIDTLQGSSTSRAKIEMEMRTIYKRGHLIVFVSKHKLPDGRIVYVGEKLEPLLLGLL